MIVHVMLSRKESSPYQEGEGKDEAIYKVSWNQILLRSRISTKHLKWLTCLLDVYDLDLKINCMGG